MELYRIWGAVVTLVIFFPSSDQLRTCGDPSKDFQIWEGACYLFEYKYGYFSDAQQACKNAGANLVSIHSDEELKYVQDNMERIIYGTYWIGMMKDSDSTGDLKDRYYWVDGSTVNYENWAPSEPNDRNNLENCVEAYHSGGWESMWNDIPCSGYKYGIACKAPALEGWTDYNGNQYFISYEAEEVEVSWYMARDWCMLNGGDLASITTQGEADQVAQWAGMNQYQGGLWIGLNKLDGTRDQWGWSDDSSMSLNLWADGYPKNHFHGHLCAYQDSKDKNGKWKNGHCDDRNKGYICKRAKGDDGPKTDPPTSIAPGYCPGGFYPNGNKCFKVVVLDSKDGFTFDDATKKCRAESGYLPDIASINSNLDQAFLTSQLQNISFGVWIGLYRSMSSQNWRWVDSTPLVYTNWAPDKPSTASEHCTEARVVPGPLGSWTNIGCSSKRGYVCETYKDSSKPINTPPSTTTHSCPDGFTPYWYGCYKYMDSPLPWTNAQAECRKQNAEANLVGIHMGAENAAVLTTVLSKGFEIWLGYKDSGDGEYKWQDGWDTWYTNWADGQPRREDDESGCVKMSTDGKWSDTTCTIGMPYVCKISQVGKITLPPPLPGRCPTSGSWEEHDQHCYLFEPYGFHTWEAAKSLCQSYGALISLASIHTATENRWISDKVEAIGGGRRSVWIGLQRSKQDNKFRWSDGSAIQFEAWAPGEPNGEERSENCVEMYNQYWPERWNDHYCYDQKGYVCKAPKMPDVTLPPHTPRCPQYWVLFLNACYRFLPDTPVMYNDAQQKCKELGGDDANLASMHDWEDNFFVQESMSILSDMPVKSDFWIGLTKMKAGEPYTWIDGSGVNFEHWSAGEPNSPDNNNENCVEMYHKTGRWNDISCTKIRGMVCKISLVDEGLSGGAIAGIVIGVLIAVIIILIVLVFFLVNQKIIANPMETYNIPNPLGNFNIPGPFRQGPPIPPPTVESDIKYEKTP